MADEPDILTYTAWARAHGKRCRTLVGYEGNQRIYRITDRPTILRDAGFRFLGSTTCNRDRSIPWVAVCAMVSQWATELSHVVYYGAVRGQIIVWGK